MGQRKSGGLALAAAAFAAALAAGSAPVGAQTTIYYGPAPGTYGNDTAATLYLRPLNNAMLGTAYFGAGYPHDRLAPVYPPAEGGSGITRAMQYLSTAGWLQERQALLAERAALQSRVKELEARVAALENTVRQLEAAAGRNR